MLIARFVRFLSPRLLAGLVLLCLPIPNALANLPNGGNGAGKAVTLTINSGANPPTVTLSNGIVTAVIDTYSSQILQLIYNGNNLTGGGTGGNDDINWQGQNAVGVQEGANGVLSVVVNPATNNGAMAEVCIANLYANQGSTNAYAADAYYYFTMFQGSPGVYVTEDMERNSSAVAGGADIPSLTSELWGSFNWLGQDTGRYLLRENPSDIAIPGVNNSPKEVTLITNGPLAGQFECKYDYGGDLNSLHFAGWASTGLSTNIGLWLIHPSHEYFSGGPKHPEIIGQFDMINCTFKSVHFGFGSDLGFTNGETWSRVGGPLFFYCNQVPKGTANPQTPLYADAAAQAAAESDAWPYTWFTADTNYAQASGRGTVTGTLAINDTGNPNASAAGMWVGLIQQSPSSQSPPTTDFQLFGKNYQFWVQADTNGNFIIPNVVAGTNYTLLAFGPGAIGLYQSQTFGTNPPPVTLNLPPTSYAVNVTGGQTNNLGIVTNTPPRVGATVWEMGVPDRDTTEFRHGSDYWHGDLGDATNLPVNWAPWQDYNLDFPNGVNFTVGQSRWSVDWDYAQPTSLDPTTGNLNGTTQNIFFNLPSAPANSASASIYFAIVGDYQGPVEVFVNGQDLNGSGFFPAYSSDPMIRLQSHGIFCDYRLNFAGNLLHAGPNEIQLSMRKGGYFSNDIMYDYIRLELSGYVPPAPTALTALSGNNVVVLNWPTSPGATSYTVSRSNNSGSGYAPLASNVIGPTTGSDVLDATFTDTSAVNGLNYFYVVTANNPNGSSANSPQAAASPSASTPPAPSAPANLTVTPGNLQAALTWNASPGAATYTVQRTVITAGANANDPGAEAAILPNGSIPVTTVNSFITTTNFTDIGLANNVTYAYTVSAANANGASAPSAAVTRTTSPAFPPTPTGLAATVVSNTATLTWNPVANAPVSQLQRATASAGPYTTVDYPEPLSFFTDGPLNYNTTYYYEVASANLAGVSSNSLPVSITTPPAPPAPITAIPGNAQTFVDWGDSVGATNYVLERATVSGGPYTPVIATNVSDYLDTPLVNGTTYYYVVYAIGTNGTSPLSVESAATPSATPQMIKSDTTNLNTAADWSGVAPVASQVGLFNNIISAANESVLVLGGDVTVGGLVFTNNLNGPVTVAAGANTLTLGASGLDLSKANQNVTFNNAIALLAPQNWSITNNRTLTVNGAFTSASNTVIVTGGGTLALGSTVNDSGANLQVNAGTVNGVASSTIKISLNGGTFNNEGAFAQNPINVMSGGTEQNPNGNQTWDGPLSGAGPLTVIAKSVHTWGGNNANYTGTITLQSSGGGGLRLNALNAVSATTAYNFSGGIINPNTTGLFSLGSLSGAGTLNTGSGQDFSIGALGLNTTYSGVIAGAGFIVKTGTGTLTLGGTNTYTGGTTVSTGTLFVAGTAVNGTGTGALTVNSGGILGGSGIVGGHVTVNSGGTLVPGNFIGFLTISNALTLASGSAAYALVSHAPLTNTSVRIVGAFTAGGTLIVSNVGVALLTNGDSFVLFNATTYSGAFTSLVLPKLRANLAWNTDALAGSGVISVVTRPRLAAATTSSGGSLVFNGTGGIANSNYYVLGTTNLTVPFANWTRLLTNQFDASGNFSFTNTTFPNWPQAFYQLQIP